MDIAANRKSRAQSHNCQFLRGVEQSVREPFIHEIIIQPNSRWLAVDWRGLLHYRDLIYLLMRRDFVSKYKQTILGPAWFVFQPLMTTAIFVVVFARTARIPTDGLPPILFYLSGLIVWSYFAQSFAAVSTSLTTNASLFNKVYFPRLVVPISIVLSNLLALAVQFGAFVVIYGYFKFLHPAGNGLTVGPALLAVPLLLAQTVAVSLGLGLIAASLTARYRDLTHLSVFLIQAGMYLTPIIYPLSMLSARWQILAALNPMAGIVEAFRWAVLGAGSPSLRLLAISVLVTLAALLAGILLFNRAERTFVDTI